jgi:hypothetical protein
MEEIVTDWCGNPIGRKTKEGNKIVVTSWVGEPLGSADEKGTRDFLGNPISLQNVPDILLKKK